MRVFAGRYLYPILEASGIEQGEHRNGVLGERLAAQKPQVDIDHLLPRQAERHLPRNDGAYARAADHVDGNAKLAQGGDHPSVSVATCAAAAEREPDAPPGEDAGHPGEVPGVADAHVMVAVELPPREPCLRSTGEPGGLRVNQHERVAGPHAVVVVGGQEPYLNSSGLGRRGRVCDEDDVVSEPDRAPRPRGERGVGLEHDVSVVRAFFLEPGGEPEPLRVAVRQTRYVMHDAEGGKLLRARYSAGPDVESSSRSARANAAPVCSGPSGRRWSSGCSPSADPAYAAWAILWMSVPISFLSARG